MAASQISSRHFSRKTLAGLSRKGIAIIGITCIPDASGSFANGETAYKVSDNGTGRIWTFRQVLRAAE